MLNWSQAADRCRGRGRSRCSALLPLDLGIGGQEETSPRVPADTMMWLRNTLRAMYSKHIYTGLGLRT